MNGSPNETKISWSYSRSWTLVTSFPCSVKIFLTTGAILGLCGLAVTWFVERSSSNCKRVQLIQWIPVYVFYFSIYIQNWSILYKDCFIIRSFGLQIRVFTHHPSQFSTELEYRKNWNFTIISLLLLPSV